MLVLMDYEMTGINNAPKTVPCKENVSVLSNISI